MANTITHKKSSTTTAIPTAGNLSAAELAVNTADGIVYTKRDDGTIIGVGWQAAFHNKIINGDMAIAQRASSATTTGYQTVDRWQCFWGGGSAITVTQSTDVPSNNEFQNSIRMTVNTADTSLGTTDSASVFYHVEGIDARDLIGNTFVVSFWARSAKTGIHSVGFRNSGLDRCYTTEYTINAANTWEYKYVTVVGGLITAGTWNWATGVGLEIIWTLASGTNYRTASTKTWLTALYLASTNQVNVLDTVNNIFALTGVQLHRGPAPLPYQHRLYTEELTLCQRYFQRVDMSNTQMATGATSAVTFSAPLPTQMRATPTATNPFLIDSNFTSTGNPIAGKFEFHQPGVAAATKTGTITTSTASTYRTAVIMWYGMTLSIVPTAMVAGSGVYIDLDAEM